MKNIKITVNLLALVILSNQISATTPTPSVGRAASTATTAARTASATLELGRSGASNPGPTSARAQGILQRFNDLAKANGSNLSKLIADPRFNSLLNTAQTIQKIVWYVPKNNDLNQIDYLYFNTLSRKNFLTP